MRHIRHPNMSIWTHIRREIAGPFFKNLRVHCTNNQGLASVFASAIAMPKGALQTDPGVGTASVKGWQILSVNVGAVYCISACNAWICER
jgi:hypothetical protein